MAALQPGIQFDSELARNSTRRDSLDSPLSTFAQAPSPSPIAAATAMPLPASPPPGPSRSPSPTSASGASHARFGSETAYAAPSPPPPSESMNFPSKTQHQHQALVTPVDSRPFDYPSPSPPPQQPLPHLPASVKAAHNHTRDLSLVSTTSSITSVKRKPLPLNAKPIAFRDSTGASSAPSFETPGPRFYRAPSIDSPTLWEAGLFKQSDIPQSLQDRQRRPPSPFQLDNTSHQQQHTRNISNHSEQSDISSVYQTEQYEQSVVTRHQEQQQTRQQRAQSDASSIYEPERFPPPAPHNYQQERPRSAQSNTSSVYRIDRDLTPTPTSPEKALPSPPPPKQQAPAINQLTLETSNNAVKEISANSPTSPDYDYYSDSAPSPPSPATHHAQSTTMPLFAKNSPGTLDLSDSNSQQQIVHNSIRSIDKPLPKSPSGETAKSPGASKLSSFFGWGGQTSPAESDTTFSDDDAENKSFSPIPSPGSSPQYQNQNGSRQLPQGIDTHSANEGYFDEGFPSPSLSNVGEMESELRAISAELATSIRREMELEDLVEGLQSELEAPRNAAGRRTSDYFSDSGNSSLKYGGDVDARADEVDRQLRKVEREKAQIRLECQEKVQEERERRKGLEKQIRQLEEKASQVDLISINSLETSGRLKDLEATCEDLRRRLAEEKQVKENFEDLLSALKSDLTASHEERDHLRDAANEQERLTYQMQMELGALKEENNMLAVDRENLMHQTERLEKEVVENHRSESDDEGAEELIASLEKELEEAETERNALRDDVVPKLKKRLQGLETESQSHGKITADLQSQVKTLTNENAAMASAKKAQDDLKHLHSLGLSMGSGMESIGEEGGVGSTFTPLGLKRSSSVVGRSPSSSGTPMRSGSRPTSMIFKNSKGEGVVVESRDQLLKKVKEVEAQRDALHDALRALLVRRKVARKDEEVRLRKVEGERDRAMARLQEISGLKDDADKRVGRVRRGERRFDAKMQQTLTIGGGEGGRMPVRITAPDF